MMDRVADGDDRDDGRDDGEGGLGEGLLTADGFEGALLGIGTRFTYDVAIYSYAKCLDILMQRDGMDRDEAEEYMEFNVAGAYVGDHTPIYLRFDTLQEWEDAQPDDET